MAAVTTYNTPQAHSQARKPFSWSYSKLKNFESCGKRHYEVDLRKAFKEEEGESLLWGNRVHSAAASRLGKGVPLSEDMARILESWCQKIIGNGDGVIHVEQKLAITRQFGGCPYFDSDAKKLGLQPWFRGIVDVTKIVGPVALVVDWKTGKILEDSCQLALNAACVFAHFPEVQRIRSEFVWLAHDANTREDFSREDMPAFWRSIWPRIEALEHAYNTTTYIAKPGGLCRRYCPVSSCPHHGGD